jgi:2-keto-4-pentenoate hydratase/2-oxohepta-3-ene-1,7-dioic acid hydratase in catechol pathway
MKLVSFRHAGRASYGVLADNTVRDLGAALAASHADLKSVLGDATTMAQLKAIAGSAPAIDRASVTLLPPIPNPSKIFCVGHNYEEHRVETGRPKTDNPAIFVRFADSLVAADEDVWIPPVSTNMDFEGELAVVIGRGGRRISRADALNHVAGFACFNDVSVRDWQRHTTQFTPGKNFPHTGAFGPWMVTADDIADPQELELTTRLNGTVMQHATTAQMIFKVADVIEYLSAFTPLSPGDVIATGTPGGVGARRDPPVWMKADDVVEIEISSIATLRNRIVAEPA